MKPRLVPGHPRLLITPRQLPEFRRLSQGPRKPLRTLLLDKLEPLLASAPALRAGINHHPERLALALGQAWRMTGDERYGRAAHWLLGSFEFCASAQPVGYDTWGVIAEAAAMLYDWLHDFWRREGLLERAGFITAFCARRALDESLHYYILDDWHNYLLGLQSGALAGALALGDEWPDFEDGATLRALHALHFTGRPSAGLFVQDAYRLPPTTRCLQAMLRSADGAGFAAHLESTTAYHWVDGFEITKIAELWTSALVPAARGGRPVWPELERIGEAVLQFTAPDGRNIGIGDGSPSRPTHWQANAIFHLQARAPRADFARWLAENGAIADGPYPNHALLRALPPGRARLRDVALPLSTLIDPIAVLRSGRDDDATMISFRCGRYGGSHNHLDNNSFTIHRGGALAIDSGSTDYGAANRTEYHIRTLAHNAILVRDPSERHWLGKHAQPTVNDGGQRLVTVSYSPPNETTGDPHGLVTEARRNSHRDEFDTGRYLAFRAGTTIDYLAGDATRAYTYPWSGIGDNQARRVEEAVRQLIFLKPDLIVVFDRVEATHARLAKKWLLHTIGAPTVVADGSRHTTPAGIHVLSPGAIEFTHLRGRLTVWPLLPQAHRVRAVGGPGYEHWVDHAVGADDGGRNYPLARPHDDSGAWRIEIEPTTTAARHCFLTVMHAGLTSEAPIVDDLRCTARMAGDHATVVIERRRGRDWAVHAEVRVRSHGAVAADIRYGAERVRETAPAPRPVPRAKRR
ncbi:MAG TPA: heparinase II/III family protein [Planctomycetota bacterium]|nr:heparinase II/III family protein [Planctomycetota bacterium]